MARASEIGADLGTPNKSVQTLQTTLHEKAKTEPSFRFYTLWDKVFRGDVLREAYRRCRRNGGAAGANGERFEDIEQQGLDRWLANLQEELRNGAYRPWPLLRVWIPKPNGKRRPLGIPTIRDRVVQAAFLVVLGPIFEADLLPQQYGFRPGVDAKMAVRRVHHHLVRDRLTEVVDADLQDYFGSVPHGSLMKCVSRRVSDGQILSTIKRWLTAPVIERTEGGEVRTTEARDRHRGTPQGGVASPLLANLYFRRFVLAWHRLGIGQRLRARVVNYADDLVICCAPGNGRQAMNEMRRLMLGLGLTINEAKTSLVSMPDGHFTFLGYTFGRYYSRKGKPYLGTRPSKRALKQVRTRIHGETSIRWQATSVEKRVLEVNRVLRGWCGYFDQGPVFREYRMITDYTERRLRRWLMYKHKRRGTGYRQYPDEYLYEELGLYRPWVQRRDRSSAKA